MINGYVGKLDRSYQSFMESFSAEANVSNVILALVCEKSDSMVFNAERGLRDYCLSSKADTVLPKIGHDLEK